MTMKRWFIIGLAIILVVVVGGWVIAEQQEKPQSGMKMECCPGCPMANQPMGMNPKMDAENPMMMWEKMAKELELTPEQKKEIEKIFLEQKKNEIKLKAELEIQHIDLLMAFRDPKSTDEKIKEIAKKIGSIQAAIEEAKIDGILKAKKLLSPEQQEKAITMFLNMKSREMGMGEAGERPMMMGPGMMGGQMMGPGMMMRQKMMKEQMNKQGNKADKEKEENEENEATETK
jgi:Spy/CpxP family protein refolding chaperone